MRHFLIIFIAFLLLTAPLYGQSINCSKENIKKMIDFGWSDYEIKQVCEKSTEPKEEPTTTTPSKPEKEKITKTTQKPKTLTLSNTRVKFSSHLFNVRP